MLDLIHVTKYLILSYKIEGNLGTEHICYLDFHKLMFDGDRFQNPLRTNKPAVKKIIAEEANKKTFLNLLDRLDLTSKKVQALTFQNCHINALPWNHVKWEETSLCDKWVHLKYTGIKYSAEEFSAAECILLTQLYTAYVLIEYNM